MLSMDFVLILGEFCSPGADKLFWPPEYLEILHVVTAPHPPPKLLETRSEKKHIKVTSVLCDTNIKRAHCLVFSHTEFLDITAYLLESTTLAIAQLH